MLAHNPHIAPRGAADRDIRQLSLAISSWSPASVGLQQINVTQQRLLQHQHTRPVWRHTELAPSPCHVAGPPPQTDYLVSNKPCLPTARRGPYPIPRPTVRRPPLPRLVACTMEGEEGGGSKRKQRPEEVAAAESPDPELDDFEYPPGVVSTVLSPCWLSMPCAFLDCRVLLYFAAPCCALPCLAMLSVRLPLCFRLSCFRLQLIDLQM